MKKHHLLLLCTTFIIAMGCSKKDEETVINCLFVSSDFDVTHSVDANNPLQVTFTVSYTGDNNLDSAIIWNFGDGTTQTLNGTSATHTYGSTGSYQATVKPTVREGDSYCTPTLNENVTLN